MIPWVLLDTAKIPGDGGELRLKKRGSEFSIMLGSNELMNSRLSGSEEALAKLSCLRIQGRERPNILIGGLGMGFTLRAALSVLGPQAEIVVAELMPSVLTWTTFRTIPAWWRKTSISRTVAVAAVFMDASLGWAQISTISDNTLSMHPLVK